MSSVIGKPIKISNSRKLGVPSEGVSGEINPIPYINIAMKLLTIASIIRIIFN